jgi:hypothetical protein
MFARFKTTCVFTNEASSSTRGGVGFSVSEKLLLASPAQSFFVLDLLSANDQIFARFNTTCVFSNGASSSTREGTGRSVSAKLLLHFASSDPWFRAPRDSRPYFSVSQFWESCNYFCRLGNLLLTLVSIVKLGFGPPWEL